MGQRADFSAAAIFVQVVDSGSFRGAARVLELPKSNVSRRVAQLEQQLGARLLQRTTRRLQLTEVGAEYYRHASVAVATLLAAERAAVDVQAEPRGPLRVTVPIRSEERRGGQERRSRRRPPHRNKSRAARA